MPLLENKKSKERIQKMQNRLKMYQSRMPQNGEKLTNQDIIPARLDAKQTADLLGFVEDDVRILTANGLLKPLGKPRPNARKFFARAEILGLSEDYSFLNKATQIVYDYWAGKNQRKMANTIRPVTETAFPA